ncbi:MAG TPA: FtsX-like permease family protein [Gaiellaceae bacterium]|nr:FtsX-like permease family protein [Gaiellaceae bacterium]
MKRVALKGLAGRKLRSLMTALAIVLGVAMVSGTFILTDTIKKGFDTITQRSYENTDAVITGKVAFASDEGDSGATSFPADVLTRVERLPEVASATGSIEDEAGLVGRDGKTIGGGPNPRLAFSVDPKADQRFNPLQLVTGSWPVGRNQIAIDRATAEKEGFGVGDMIRVAARGPVRSFEISGIAEFADVSIGGATLAIFDVPTAQELLDKDGKLDVIRVAASPGVSPSELVQAIRPLMPETAQVRSSAAQVQEETDAVGEFLGFLRTALLAFAGIALFVGSFVIANTLSITIAQRMRELATLRTLGASRRQVLGSVLLEALVLGLIASVIGLALGLGLAQGLNALFAQFGIDLPETGTVLAARTVVVSLLVGVIVTVLASLRPALRATRIAPIAAVREGATLPPGRFARFGPVTSLAVIGLSVALLAFGVFAGGLATSTRLLSLGAGCLMLFVGVALIASRLVRPLALAVGWPAAKLGGAAGVLARENSMRNPARTAATAAALMIGLALVTFVAIFAQGIKKPFDDAVDRLFVADYALIGDEAFSPTAPAAGEAAAGASGAEVVSGVREGEGRAFGKDILVTAVDRNATKVLAFDWIAGSDDVPAALGRTGAFVKDKYAKERGLSIGSRMQLKVPTGEILRLNVLGVFDEPTGGSPFGEVTISTATFDSVYQQPTNVMTFVNMRGGVTDANTSSLEQAVSSFPDVSAATAEEFKQAAEGPINDLLNMLYVLLGLSVIVSVFGIVNTLVLTVFERTRELGMLRAVGMTRRQVRRMIRHESIVTSLIGATLGITVGAFLALLVTRALEDQGIVFAIPFGSLATFVAAAIVVGFLAAILPARRAARLNVLRALQYE